MTLDTPLRLALRQSVDMALAEDIGSGDITAQLIDAASQARAIIISREAGIVCGTAWVDHVFHSLDPAVSLDWKYSDGEPVSTDTVICELHGPARALLSGERTALNFLQTLSGTATTAHQYALAVKDTACVVLDTRKTIPGLRLAQKYAVRCGGGQNHRLGLFDAFLIKENHIAAAGSIAAAITRARSVAAHAPVEIEVESLAEFDQALAARADIVMLDELSLEDMAEAVKRNRALGSPAKLEASGSIDLARLRTVALTGVDYISIGALTKHVHALDLSMRLTIQA